MVNKNKTFCITENHLKLMRCMIVRWDSSEFGSPEINHKKPYGNNSVYVDIIEILGVLKDSDIVSDVDILRIYQIDIEGRKWNLLEDDVIDGVIPVDLKKVLTDLHRETETALQIFLQNGQVELGTYQNIDYQGQWIK